MYTSHFNLREVPFSIAPDPAYLYLSARHQEALGHLLYGTGQYGGFVQLTGEVGTGKTTIIRTLLAQKLDGVNVAMIHNPRQSEREFVQSICDELGVDYDRSNPSLKTLVDALNQWLLAQHAQDRRTVLIIDEAQQLAPEVLEQVRLLTNLETSKAKLLRIMLVGQPELAELLARQDLRQLAQRITARYHLMPLSADETGEYIAHRLQVAGGARDLFTPAAVKAVQRHSGGVPRLMNILCDRALLGAYSLGLRTVTPDIIHNAAAEALAPLPASRRDFARTGRALRLPALPRLDLPRPSLRWLEIGLAVAGLVIAGLLLQRGWQSSNGSPAPRPAAVAAAATQAAEPVTEPTAERVAPSPPESAARKPAANAPETAARAATTPAPPPPAARKNGNARDRVRAASASLAVLMPRLGRLWLPGFAPPRGEKACRALHRQRLECLKGNAEWSDLAALDAPAILTLSLGKGDVRYALLNALGSEYATLSTENGPLRLPLAELDPLWTGEYLLLWKRETDEISIGPEIRGEPIQWLRKRLAERLKIAPDDTDNSRWDDGLRQQVLRFQTAQGIRPDGVAGARTLAALADRRGTPRLKGRE